MSIYAQAKHGIVYATDTPPENYFGWPSVAILADDTIVAGCSGPRRFHVCPWGKSSVFYSKDGENFSAPQIVHDDLIDNRDLGVVAMGGQKFAITWFSLDVRTLGLEKRLDSQSAADAVAYMATWKDDTVKGLMGSWLKITSDGGKSWTRPIRVPVSAPHGFICLRNGELGYLGKGYDETLNAPAGMVRFAVSADGGFTWTVRGDVGVPEGETMDSYHEPHVIELKDGTLMGAIRYHVPQERGGGVDVCLTFSQDGGRHWTLPERMNIDGTPPHLLRHSSGAIVLSYGYRNPGYGQRARVSYDEGRTWSEDIVIRDDGESGDLGYPCSIELRDGSIFTVYYQALPGRKNTSILWSRWMLPER